MQVEEVSCFEAWRYTKKAEAGWREETAIVTTWVEYHAKGTKSNRKSQEPLDFTHLR